MRVSHKSRNRSSLPSCVAVRPWLPNFQSFLHDVVLRRPCAVATNTNSCIRQQELCLTQSWSQFLFLFFDSLLHVHSASCFHSIILFLIPNQLQPIASDFISSLGFCQ